LQSGQFSHLSQSVAEDLFSFQLSPAVIAKQCQSAILPGKRFRFGAVELLLGGTAGSKKEFAQGGNIPRAGAGYSLLGLSSGLR
jgi:hypothetical protein